MIYYTTLNVCTLGAQVDSSEKTLTDHDVDMIIMGWEAMKPKEPNRPEPMFVWPPSFGFRYFVRVWIWKRKMKATSWDFFHERYQQWMSMITTHYNLLAGNHDRYHEPQLMRLWKYQMNAQGRLRQNSISQSEWNRQKSTNQ
jgi:hypothetical protein